MTPALYVESSAILSWLFGEARSSLVRDLLATGRLVVSASLTLVEAERALVRGELDGRLSSAQRRLLRGLLAREVARWRLAELTATVRARASQPFPVEPVRSLDAIHLASALEVLELYPDLQVLSFDERIRANLAPLGLVSADAG